MSNLSIFFILTICSLIHPAEAYIDPGSGSYLVQVLIGCFLGTLITIKSFWRQLWAWLRFKSTKRSAETTAVKTSNNTLA